MTDEKPAMSARWYTSESATSGADIDREPAPVPATYEQRVLSKLTAIAWFTGIVAVVTLFSVIMSIVAAAQLSNR